METKCSLLKSQQFVTCAHHEPHKSTSLQSCLIPISIISSHIVVGPSSGFFPPGLPLNTVYLFLTYPADYMPRPSNNHVPDRPS